ncbi:Membrane protein [Pedobacter cryoconitis]|uniref:Membrane protein n=1 Tax=Pedobacter cryoconitis TaxID=188932 RepID=A0A127VDN6_9SPHI|nr:low affinity iron permease family protein [Pedobacter cryoconitis]AMP99300.1 Membrane protein [Pedobacter cryoconitis]
MEKKKESFFEQLATKITCWTGSSAAFGIALLVVIVWGISGPIFKYSDTWQLVINTGTTIITFMMVFLIQKSQNKDSKAIQLKLNELIAASRHASNRMVDIEDLTEQELDVLHKYYQKLSDISEEDDDIHNSHSIDAATNLEKEKVEHRKKHHKDQTSESES